jgi:hypothetical protein
MSCHSPVYWKHIWKSQPFYSSGYAVTGSRTAKFDPDGPICCERRKRGRILVEGSNSEISRTENIEFHYTRMTGNSPDLVSIIRVVP